MFSCDFALIKSALAFIKKSLGTPSEYIDVETSSKKGTCRLTGVHEGKTSSVIFEANVKSGEKFSIPFKYIDSIHAKGITGFGIADNVLGYKDSHSAKGSSAILSHKGYYRAVEKDSLVNSEVISKAIAIVQKILISPLPGFKEPDVLIKAYKEQLSIYVGDNFHISYVEMKLDSYQTDEVILTIPLKQFKLLSAMEKPQIYITNDSLVGIAKGKLARHSLVLPSLAKDETLRDNIESRKNLPVITFKPEGEFLDAVAASCKLDDVTVRFDLDGNDSTIKAISSNFEQTLPVVCNGKKSASFAISSHQARDFVKVARHIKSEFILELLKDTVRIAFADEHKCALLITIIA